VKIPILNLYYLISYASGILNPAREKVPAGIDDGYNLADLYARLLSEGIENLFSRGLYRQYVGHVEDIAGIRGQLQFSESLRQNKFHNGRAVCKFDELHPDILVNQLLKAGMVRLLMYRNLNHDLTIKLRTLVRRMAHISEILLQPQAFGRLMLNRNMLRYRFLLFITRMVMEHSSVREDGDEVRFIDLERDEDKLATLFEAFVRNFYDVELADYVIARRKLSWSFELGEEDKFIPQMQTDIPLESDRDIFIIDTKYYASALKDNRYGTAKFSSSNMYQMFAYMEHYPNPKGKPLTGILLYPKVSDSLDMRARSNRNPLHEMRFQTLDLSVPWPEIRKELLNLVSS